MAYQSEISFGTAEEVTMEGDPMNIEPVLFEYDQDSSRTDNFDTWLRRTNREHRAYNEKEYSIEVGLKIFNKIYPRSKI